MSLGEPKFCRESRNLKLCMLRTAPQAAAARERLLTDGGQLTEAEAARLKEILVELGKDESLGNGKGGSLLPEGLV